MSTTDPKKETTVKIGGKDFVVGGWADYEIDKMREENKNEMSDFAGRSFVTLNDLVHKMGGIGSTIAIPVNIAYEELKKKTDEYTSKFVKGGRSVIVVPPRVRTPSTMDELYETVNEFESFARNTDHGVKGGNDSVYDKIPIIPPSSPVLFGGDPGEKIARIEHEAHNHLYEVEKFYSSLALKIEGYTDHIDKLSNLDDEK